jgi:hypothetical protein
MNWARPWGTVAQVGFKPTALRVSSTGIGERCCTVFPLDQQAVGRSMPMCWTGTSPSLSPPPIKRTTPVEASFSPSLFLPNVEVRHPAAHRRLATVWIHHWAIPRVQLIPTPLRFYWPRFQHHRSIPPPSTIYHASDFCHRRWAPSSMLLVTSEALPNVRYTYVQLRSRARSTFTDLTAVSTLNTVCCHRSDRLASETPVSSHLF